MLAALELGEVFVDGSGARVCRTARRSVPTSSAANTYHTGASALAPEGGKADLGRMPRTSSTVYKYKRPEASTGEGARSQSGVIE